ncbi:hypothetical protein EQG49_00005 [Periweissella cryptocerci]|uniref:LURP-one-related family protein n=1 Tax=Periweissella cryptocerci TaxID=2506420 RepID=A0A4P6YQR1_9LACO|nr:LURP-one-related family protein [Periweissella cryptocerci]QBO34937.1 hypothetical protein EQG49_00005 [Periweissella cryptocerci]
MSQLYIKQKVFSIGDKYTVTDAQQRPQYAVAGSLFKIPKEFVISNMAGQAVGKITQRMFQFLPKFTVSLGGRDVAVISKRFSLFRPSYDIDAFGLTIQGNFWDMNFTVLRNGQQVAQVDQRWLSWGDTYEINVADESLELLIVSLTVAIDYVKQEEADTSNSSV